MDASTDDAWGRSFPFDDIATAVLDERGTVLHWSRAASDLLEFTAEEACGSPVWSFLADPSAGRCREDPPASGIPPTGRAVLRRSSGDRVEVAFRVVRLEGSAQSLVLALPAQHLDLWNQSTALARALFAQDRIEIGILGPDLGTVRTNAAPSETPGGSPAFAGGILGKALSPGEAEEVEAGLRRVLETGVPLIGGEPGSPRVPGRQWSLSAFRLEDARGRPTGVATLFIPSTAQQRDLHHLDLLHEASERIGTSLNILRTSQDLAEVLVPAFADMAWVDLAEAVFQGDEPPKLVGAGLWHLRRAVAVSATGPIPGGLLQPGEPIPPLPDPPALRKLRCGETVLASVQEAVEQLGPELTPLFVPERGHSVLQAPLFARGLLLGAVLVWRTDRPEPFVEEDRRLLAEIASRAALSVDNARRYTREHHASVALQRRLLPRTTSDIPAVEAAGSYVPAGGGADIGGDWFDVIPLPSFRVALVVGDVVGHGLHATATMGRLRTAVQTLADLELDPGELLTHVDDLVQQLAEEAGPAQPSVVGATCLYALYDPISRQCAVASAGHPPPVLLGPDGTARLVEITPGPPLGVGGMPFEVTNLPLEPGSILALYTDGLVTLDGQDIEDGMAQVVERLAALCDGDGAAPLDGVGRSLLSRATEAPPRDDVALLLARTRALPDDSTTAWEFPADPAVVAEAREAATGQLAAWGLDHLAFTTELIVSELVTNAIRYAGGPIVLRLIRGNVLICEVSDPSNTQPRLCRARWTDEGGRGLYLVAQLTTRWGSRYGRRGKTIWSEQPLAPAMEQQA
ncbi:SpoIIE family protein phosphatase [Streptomyces sp. ML-6]|uniref:SpoIIE family protein phosphatase n=1 Tax=Streptomyces sp. ML-6 TaxID=2982693 RepID=UPI0024C099D8|nr:SpoIIE family protein phosphatase [Streptomyces sp. ML-6]MDK0524250.1 SpoIIE family protein phosphatase [Streptomyces sp. ML-6]